jgi:hypothetical protein
MRSHGMNSTCADLGPLAPEDEKAGVAGQAISAGPVNLTGQLTPVLWSGQ